VRITFRKDVRGVMNVQIGDRITYHVEGKQVRIRKNTTGYKINPNWQAIVPAQVLAVLKPRKAEKIIIADPSNETAFLTVVARKSKKQDVAVIPEQLSYRKRVKLAGKYEKSLKKWGKIELRESLNSQDVAHVLRHLADLIEGRKNEHIELKLSYQKIHVESENAKPDHTRPVYTYSVLMDWNGSRQTVTHVTTCDLHYVSEEILDEYPGCEIIYLIPQ